MLCRPLPAEIKYIFMKQYSKIISRPAGLVLLMLLLWGGAANAQVPEGHYGALFNTGYVSHSNGGGVNSFTVTAGASYDAFTYGPGVDDFVGAGSVPTSQAIDGTVAPNFGTVNFNNGSVAAFGITNTAGINVNTTLAFNNGITFTLRSTRTVGIPGAIHFAAGAGYTPVITPVAGADARFTDGYISKVNPASFIYPVGNGSALRPVTATGTGTFTTAWSNTDVNTVYTGALPSGVVAINTNGYWEWAPSAVSTAIVSIPDETAFATAANLTIVGYNGTAWTDLGGTFSANTENAVNGAAVSVPANIVAIALGSKGPANVPLSIKVFLEGDMGAGATMRTDLQNYFGGNTGLLPTTSPYGAPTNTYAAINNPAGAAGLVADWVKVEVRLASTGYSTAAETQSLLLKSDGTIVTSAGTVPVFAAQVGTVRLVITHRNHLAIMSNDVTAFNSAKSYDFSTALSQASNAGDPPQMKLVNGVYTMIAADVNIDYAIDGTDGSIYNNDFNAGTFDVYTASDLNMDGVVDGSDGSYFNTNFNAGYFSTLINY
jgi:hypothetical protein